jgi:hypothetical protein
VPGEGLGQRQDALDLLLRRQSAALELDRPETVLADHPLRLTDQGFRRDHLAPGIRLGVDVRAVLVEEVRGEVDLVAGPPARRSTTGRPR